ncbi:MAG: carbohydrate kinase [Clostridia bacterium]|nr:carbohydrate kinase [Clostridia bacterium]
MIAFIGEILVDMFGEKKDGKLAFQACIGGATLNAGASAKKTGAKVAFVGRVGKDTTGKFLISEAEKVGFDILDIQVDNERNTTLAFVTLVDGERDFAFNRHDTADYNIDFHAIDFEKFENLTTIYVGSIMLSEQAGREFADKLIKKAKSLGVKVCFDVNFRMDLYGDFNQAVKAYKPMIDGADVVKFSDDELVSYTGIEDKIKAIESFYKKDKLVIVTLGSKGSMYYLNGKHAIVPTLQVKPIDTTGAGDAFFGALLACLENKELTEETVKNALVVANKAGADATQYVGALNL